MDCIYCGLSLREARVREAHVIPNGMGGRLSSVTTVCNNCNESFAGIEGDACERLQLMGAFRSGCRGDGTLIVADVEYDGGRYQVEGGNSYQLAPPPTDRGTRWPMPAKRLHQVSVIAVSLLQRRLPAEAMLDGRYYLERGPDADEPVPAIQHDPIEHVFRWNDRPVRRVMVKMGIELLAKLVDGATASREELTLARRFARHDESDIIVGVDNETTAAGLPLVTATYAHGCEVWSAGTSLYFRVILFSRLSFVGQLTQSWRGKPVRMSYSFDIATPKRTSVVVEACDGATPVNKSSRVRRREFDDAIRALEAYNLATAERRRGRAAMPSFEELYLEVKAEIERRTRRR